MKQYRAVGLDHLQRVMEAGFWWDSWDAAVDDAREMSKTPNPYTEVMIEVRES